MKTKILKFKYTKNPRTLLDKPEVQTYLWHLENTSALDELPLPFLVYYVVGCILTDEVNNGGFAQYLSNSSVKTLPYLEKCVKAINNAELIVICSKLISIVSENFNIENLNSIAESEYSEEFEEVLSELDDRFYALDEKNNVENLSKKYYRENIPTEKLVFELVKPPVTEYRRYFVYDKSEISNEEAARSFMNFLAEFSNIKFEIVIEKWNNTFRICAIDFTNSLNLAEIQAHFDDSSYVFGKKASSDRRKILGFRFGGDVFKEIHIDSSDDENWVWRLTINESKFDDNEYEISYSRFYSITPYDKKVSRIFAGDFDNTKIDLAALEEIFIEYSKTQKNITRIYEKINNLDIESEDKIKILYEA